MFEIDGILERVSGLAGELKLASLEPRIAACRKQLSGSQGIDVAVLGRFKAGKSSFLNHLTGRAVLPIGVAPVTAVVTRLRYGPKELAEVRFLDGTAKTVLPDDIGLYVSESENHDNEKRVASVELELPALRTLAPLEFVDTPGLDSVFLHNTETALQWLPNVGTALVAVSSDAPLSGRDLALLEELRKHTPKIVLLLTKADLLTEPQRAEVLEFVRRELRRKWETEIPVFFYSIRSEWAGLKTELEQELLFPLLRNRSKAGSQIARHKLISLADQTLNYLQIALAAATQAESARLELRKRLAEEHGQFDLFRAELCVLGREWSAKALDWSLEQLRPTQAALKARITADLQEQFRRWQLRMPPMLEAWREWMGDFLNQELNEVSCSQRAMFCQPLHRASQHLTRTLRAFQDRLAEHVNKALGIAPAPREFWLEIREPSAPPVDVSFAFDAAFATLGHVIPLGLFRRPIERALRRKARYEVEKNVSRLAAAWRDRVAKGIVQLTKEAEQQALDELAALEQMLGQTASMAPELTRAIYDLEQFKKQLAPE